MALEEPKKPQTGYWIWLGENRQSLVKELGHGKGSAVAQLGGVKWKALTEQSKKPYEQKATDAKVAYVKAMEEFKAAGGEVGKRRLDKKDAKNAKVDKKEKKESRKNSGAPKRPPSSFWLWQVANRDALVKEAGTNKISVIGKLAGVKWATITEAQKAPYATAAKEKQVEYQKSLAEWKASNVDAEDDAEDDKVDDEDGDDPAPEKPESPAKKARTDKATAPKTVVEPKKMELNKAAEPKKAPARGKAKAKADQPKLSEIDQTTLANATKLGFDTGLRNLANREDLKDKGISHESMLKALQQNGGLVNKAKTALLGGA